MWKLKKNVVGSQPSPRSLCFKPFPRFLSASLVLCLRFERIRCAKKLFQLKMVEGGLKFITLCYSKLENMYTKKRNKGNVTLLIC
jgi:hypothetical protein